MARPADLSLKFSSIVATHNEQNGGHTFIEGALRGELFAIARDSGGVDSVGVGGLDLDNEAVLRGQHPQSIGADLALAPLVKPVRHHEAESPTDFVDDVL